MAQCFTNNYFAWSIKTSKLYIGYLAVCIYNIFNTNVQPTQSNPGINNKELELLIIAIMQTLRGNKEKWKWQSL